MEVDGGIPILQEIMYRSNGTEGYYRGAEPRLIETREVMQSPAYDMKQASTAIVMTGRDKAINRGKTKSLALMETRIKAANGAMENLLNVGIFSDGTGFEGRQINGLQLFIPVNSARETGVVGGLNRAQTGEYWRSKNVTGFTRENVKQKFQELYSMTTRGSDMVDLIVCDNNVYNTFHDALELQERFMGDKEKASGGFRYLQWINADVVNAGGIGGACPADTAFFLNCDYMHWRPYMGYNMVVDPQTRYPADQDLYIKHILWYGNMTTSGLQFQGRLEA